LGVFASWEILLGLRREWYNHARLAGDYFKYFLALSRMFKGVVSEDLAAGTRVYLVLFVGIG